MLKVRILLIIRANGDSYDIALAITEDMIYVSTNDPDFSDFAINASIKASILPALFVTTPEKTNAAAISAARFVRIRVWVLVLGVSCSEYAVVVPVKTPKLVEQRIRQSWSGLRRCKHRQRSDTG